jgi:hypothetical protein
MRPTRTAPTLVGSGLTPPERVPRRECPDSGQPDAVLAIVKASPGKGGVCGEAVATASLDFGYARRPGARAGRDMA